MTLNLLCEQETPEPIYRALARRVLAVAVWDDCGEWAAYVDAVPGERHADEWPAVMREGVKMGESLARQVFTEIEEDYRQ